MSIGDTIGCRSVTEWLPKPVTLSLCSNRQLFWSARQVISSVYSQSGVDFFGWPMLNGIKDGIKINISSIWGLGILETL